MTALAIALVLCCAMVCGTVLSLGHLRYTRAAHYYADKADKALSRADTAMDTLRLAGERMEALDKAGATLRAEVDSLRSHVALRGL